MYIHMYSDEQTNERDSAVTSKVQNLHSGSVEPNADQKLAGISKARIQKRKQWIQNGVGWGMNPEQIERYTDIMGDRVNARQVRNYIADLKLSKSQRYKIDNQSHHDNMVINAFLKIGQQLSLAGYPPSVIQFNSSPGEGAGFRYDFKFRANGHLFFGEVQLSDLAGTNWRKKHKQYVRFRKQSDTPFRVLWIVDQNRDMSLIRYNARQAQKEYPNLNLHFYLALLDLVHSDNVITKPVWKNVAGKACIAIDLA